VNATRLDEGTLTAGDDVIHLRAQRRAIAFTIIFGIM
jgi:hypothetical protein